MLWLPHRATFFPYTTLFRSTPIGVEKVGSGYEVAWKAGSADQYIVWNADSNGNYTGSATGIVSGSEYALQLLETTFHQDLNADGTTGPKTITIEASGTTHLDQVANEFFLQSEEHTPA